jgi:hypothetical protein
MIIQGHYNPVVQNHERHSHVTTGTIIAMQKAIQNTALQKTMKNTTMHKAHASPMHNKFTKP